jgi:subtilase family serine protease
VEAAFHVSIKDYRSSDGQTFFANDTDVQIPASLSGTIVAVLGLTNVAALRPLYQRSSTVKPHYGGGPGGTGLTPSQIAGIYGATPVYRHLHEAGQGVTFGLVELSGYTPSDISVYENTFFPGLPHVPLVNIPVNGGATDHKDAGEVELDIEMQIALAKASLPLQVIMVLSTALHKTHLILRFK